MDKSILSVHDPDMNYSPISDENVESDGYSGEPENGENYLKTWMHLLYFGHLYCCC